MTEKSKHIIKAHINILANHLNKYFGLNHNSAQITASMIHAAGCGSAARVVLPGAEELSLDCELVALSPESGNKNHLVAAKWILADMLKLQKHMLDVNQNMKPESSTRMRNLWALILADDLRISDEIERKLRRNQHKTLSDSGEFKHLREEDLVESRSFDYNTLARLTATEASNVQLQLKPLMYGNSLTEKLFTSWSRWVFDGHLVLANNTLNAFPDIAAGTQSTAQAHAELLRQANQPVEHSVFDQTFCEIDTFNISTLLALPPHECQQFLREQKWLDTGLPQRALYLPPCERDLQMVDLDTKQEEDLQTIRRWLVHERLTCPARTVRVKLSPEAAALYLAECPASPPQTDDPLELSTGQHALHAAKLAAGWCLADEDPQIQLEDLQTALRMVRQAHEDALPHLRKLCEGPVRPPDFEHRLSEMVEKVRDKGSVSRRNLFRSYSDQKVSIHQPVLDAAVERGLIIEDDGMLRAFKLTDSASVADSGQTEGADGTEPKGSEIEMLHGVAG